MLKRALAFFSPLTLLRHSALTLSLSLGILSCLAIAQSPLSSSSIGIGQQQFLPVDQAFRYYTAKPQTDLLTIHWDIAPGYYLYQDKFTFAINGTTFIATLPAAQQHSDEFFGDVEVYYGRVTATIALPEALQSGQAEVEIQFQGCAEAGLCYPPQRTTLTLDL